jgi:hypothetical protein
MATQESEPFWRQHVDTWRASGLTQKRYSKRHGLAATTLTNWSSVQQRRTRKKSDQALVPMRVGSPLHTDMPIATVDRPPRRPRRVKHRVDKRLRECGCAGRLRKFSRV